MAKHKITIIQTYHAERSITIEVDSPKEEGVDGALEQVRSGSVDVPCFEDPRWKTTWELTDEEYCIPAEETQKKRGGFGWVDLDYLS